MKAIAVAARRSALAVFASAVLGLWLLISLISLGQAATSG